MATHGTMETFSGKGWSSWVERLVYYFEANGIREGTKKWAVLLTLCGPSIFETVKALVAPKSPSDKTFEIVNLLQAHFDPRPSELFSRSSHACHQLLNAGFAASFAVWTVRLLRFAVEEQVPELSLARDRHKACGIGCLVHLPATSVHNNIINMILNQHRYQTHWGTGLRLWATQEGGENGPDLSCGSSVSVVGSLVPSRHKAQDVEIHADEVTVLGPCDVEKFPFRPRKNYAPDYVRSFLHLRPRLSREAALLRVRSAALVAVHSAFQAEGFFHIHTPVITSNDCEGGGDVFSIKPLKPASQAAEESKGTKEDAAAREHFFGGPAFLTVSGQLHLEAAAMSLSRVYTVSPTFRAENCNTRRHLCEFCMVEAEEAFLDSLDALMDRTELLVKRSFNHILGSAEQDVDLVTREAPAGHVKTVAAALDEPFPRLTYDECIGYLKAADNRAFSHSVQWADNLKTEHEEFIVKHCGNRPVFVTHFPASLKPFYMKRDSTGNLVEGFDLLVPYGGELCGGSLREDSYEVLKERMEALGMSDNFSWYLDLREFGSVPHGGFGLGFDRMLQYFLGIHNIKDVVTFPRWSRHCQM